MLKFFIRFFTNLTNEEIREKRLENNKKKAYKKTGDQIRKKPGKVNGKKTYRSILKKEDKKTNRFHDALKDSI